MIKYIVSGLLVALLASAQWAIAEEGKAVIDYVNKDFTYVVIGDMSYDFALNAKVYDQKGRAVNRYALKVGMLVEFDFDRRPHDSGTLKQVKIVSTDG